MEIKILQVFYGKDGLPYKDKDRQVHFPITGTGFLGASNTTKIKFYYDELDNLDETTWVAVSKLPNGKLGSRVLESYLDEELNEHYALLELGEYYTQYKGDVFISLQGYQGGVNLDFNEETQQYEIHGTPTIAATGSIKFTINYATQFVGSGETSNVNFQRILADLGTKLGIRAQSEHVEELPSVGQNDIFYVVNDDPNNPNLQNIYVWNENTQSYVWVGDNTLDLGEYYTKDQGEQFEEEIGNRVSSVENELSSVASGSPKGVYATLADLQAAYPTGTTGIYLVVANGHWYYWNGSAWTDGGQYLSSNVFTGLLATNTDLNTVTATSTYMLLASYTYSNLPKPITSTYNWALLETINTVGNNIIQMFTDTGDGSKYYRIKSGGSGTWSGWYFSGSNQETRNLNVGGVDANIDNIRNYGIYLLLPTAQGTLPETITTYGMLFVIYASGTSCQQIYSGNSGNLFIRYYNSGVWSEWTELHSNLFPAGYNYPYIFNKGVRCNKANNTVTAYYAGVDCGEGVKVDVNSVRYCWAKAKTGQTSGALALIMNPNGCDKISQITDLSLHLVLTASHLKVDILGNRYGQYYYQNLINADLINAQSLDGTTNHTVTLVARPTQNKIDVYIDGTDTYTGVFTPDANISSLNDVIGPYALFEHYCNGDMNNYAMPIFKQWLVRQGDVYYVYDNFDRENGQLQNTPQGLPYHLFSTIHNNG